MEINFEYYKVFYYVAKYGKISEAAEKLFISQPAITQTIKKLEESLKMQLFYRNREGVILTEPGKNIYEYIKDAVVVLENAEKKSLEYEKLEVGSIRIRTGNSVANDLLKDALIKFIKKYKNINIDISTGRPDDSMKLLSQGDIDLVLLNLPYKNHYSNIIIEECMKKEYIFVVSPEYKEKENVQINKMQDLQKYELIFPKKASSSRNIYDDIMSEDVKIKPSYEITSETMKADLAENGCGIAFVDRKLVEDKLKKGSLIEIELDKKFYASEGIAMLQPSIANYAVKELVKMIKENLNN